MRQNGVLGMKEHAAQPSPTVGHLLVLHQAILRSIAGYMSQVFTNESPTTGVPVPRRKHVQLVQLHGCRTRLGYPNGYTVFRGTGQGASALAPGNPGHPVTMKIRQLSIFMAILFAS